ncbi:Flp pilus assembly complex ATPase component TadA [Pseudomonas gingeri]|uniref:Flp pilus assembly complex ATPase component TadA n=1 Tax=Pseudomonas gingeri TaxID=117681 RepID=A0A7Y7X885_9PSED|nr:ATPase, T2SS/T4P/T4SS family [Pseudomonas gingeri]NWB94871.1 Flp pilus assembly complex ATPase component TadA [Pseudomonas gingeri]
MTTLSQQQIAPVPTADAHALDLGAASAQLLTLAGPEAQAINQELADDFPIAVGRVLTAVGESWEIKPELRQLCALTDDGYLYVSKQHLTDHYVMGLMDRLERADVNFEVIPSSMSEILAIYQAQSLVDESPTSASSSTQRQQEVIALMGRAHKAGASDIHFVVGHEITRIAFRVHGLLTNAGEIPSSKGIELCSSLYNSMCDVAKEHYQPEISQDARVSRKFVEQLGLFGARVSTRPLVDGPLMVLRLLSDDKSKQTLKDLGFLPVQIGQIRRLCRLPYGVNFITGPTGSGKSKTLQVNINLLSNETRGTRHILTVEDPPEYPLLANQSPKSPEETWEQAIANSLRLDPDILMYGEVRDLASCIAAFSGGLTGHLVLSTLHTNNAVASLQRLIDMGMDISLVTDPALLTGIVNQSLLPVLCEHCRKPAKDHLDELDSDLVARLQLLTKIEEIYLQGDGCKHCRMLGFTTRTAVAEVLVSTHGFMKVFREKGAGEARNYWVQQMGGITKTAHTLIKVRAGLIDPRIAETIVGPLDFDNYILEQKHVG